MSEEKDTIINDELKKKEEELKRIINNNLQRRTLDRIINEYHTRNLHNEESDEEEQDNNEEEQKNDSKEKQQEQTNTEPKEEKTEEEEQEEENEEKRILERLPEEKIAEYINETLKRVIKGENMLDDMKTFMDFVRIIPKNMFDENSEYYATVLSNATINGVKLFDDVDAARDFINDIRNKRRSKKWLRPKAQKQIKQEIQKSLQISPMMLKNIKHRMNAINVYQY